MHAVIGLALLAMSAGVLIAGRSRFAGNTSYSAGSMLGSMLAAVLFTVLVTFGIAELVRFVLIADAMWRWIYVAAGAAVVLTVLAVAALLQHRARPVGPTRA